ncbi:MAG: carboxyl transferase domain-containing protein [Dehalococcoidales bacterium]|jgi:acetyl-CoA carboxylase carboxyltransferase component|nr:carboxyl transferase domain-containing protein [Dehalococcoidales bacterium]MDP7525466.1 carboxyl transferase domain-containing protein [Dehalococcoidales bacterium]
MSDDVEIKKEQLKTLKERRVKAAEMGGSDRVATQKKKGKLTARERIAALLDEGSFRETGLFAKSRGTVTDIAADAVITGYGSIDGKKVYIYSQDFTSTGGTLAEIHSQKICRVLDSATREGHPVIGLNDSGGARIQDGVDALAGYGKIFFRNTRASGVIPQICAILGPNAGGAVYSPALMDFTFMVKGISYAYITGPRVVKAAMGQEVNDEELGGAVTVQKKAGVACRSEDSEEECFQHIRELLSFLPSNNRAKLPSRIDWGDTPDREDSSLFDIVPAAPNKPYDMHRIIESLFDRKKEGQNYFELFPIFATNIITCFSRLNGWSVGIIANQPMSKAGCLDIDASDKASRFIRFCDAFGIPIINLVDVPGYLPGTEQEWGGIIRHGAKMLFAYSEATVPKITLTIRKAYGGSYLGMCSKDLGADFVFCWPSTELAVMGAEGAAPIIFRRELESADDSEKLLEEKIREYRQEFANPYRAAEHLHVDDVLDPAETRPRLIEALEMVITKTEDRPAKKHGTIPT